MNLRFNLVRIFAVASSVTLLAGYVVYSHVTPNTPPPDPLGINTIALEMDAEAVEFDSLVKDKGRQPSSARPRNDLRIISSKVINQPIFHVRKREADALEFRATTAEFNAPGFLMVRDLEVIPGVAASAPQAEGSFLKRPVDSLEQPEIIKRIMSDDDIAVGNEKVLTPEKLAEDYYRALEMRRMMMSGSKSPVLRFDSLPSMRNPVLPIKPAPVFKP